MGEAVGALDADGPGGACDTAVEMDALKGSFWIFSVFIPSTMGTDG